MNSTDNRFYGFIYSHGIPMLTNSYKPPADQHCVNHHSLPPRQPPGYGNRDPHTYFAPGEHAPLWNNNDIVLQQFDRASINSSLSSGHNGRGWLTVDEDQAKMELLNHAILLFNTGLTYHLVAAESHFQSSSYCAVEKSLRLYEMAFHLAQEGTTMTMHREQQQQQQEQYGDVLKLLLVVLPNNMGQILYELGLHHLSKDMFIQALWGMSTGRGDRGKIFCENDWAGLVFNTMVLQHQPVSAEAA
uniref:Uncharacterized protein n=1 Tax=Cyclophora tenuis TaxID=216820 RepID=A0A7S1D540_CYCTE